MPRPSPNLHSLPGVVLLAAVLTLLISVASWPLDLYPGDPAGPREEGRALLLHGTLAIDAGGGGVPGFLGDGYFVPNPRDGRAYSKWGVLNGVATVPPLALEYLVNRELPAIPPSDRVYYFNLWNTALTVAAAALLTRLAARFLAPPLLPLAPLFTLVCLFTTFLWNYTRAQSGELLQLLLLAAAADALLSHLRTPSTPRLALLWTALTALVLTRVYYLTLLPPVLLTLWWATPSRPLSFRLFAAALPPLLLVATLAAFNTLKFGAPHLTGYHARDAASHLPTLSPLPGLYGFLLSPTKSAFLHFPPLLLALPAWPAFARRFKPEARAILLAAACYFFPLCTIPTWAGDWGYGPRYLAPALPFVALPALLLPTLLASKPRLLRHATTAAVALLLALSLYLNFTLNRLGFFAVQTVRASAEGPGAPPEVRAYFDARPWSVVAWHMLHTDGRAERLPFWSALPPHLRDDLREAVWFHTQTPNHWWPVLGKQFDDRRYDRPPRLNGE